jgi:CheY-like chemotaxis protein
MYRVTCSSCGKPYDATKAMECNCLQPVRSYRCPNCAACFCSNRDRLDEFWRDAPPEMWQRRRVRTDGSAAAVNETPENVKRPLVLFADDDPAGRAIATRVIQSLGYGCVVAVDGEEALSMAREYAPELIITDALMPRLDGREMSRIVKAERPRTKVVVITSVYKDPRYKYEALKDFAVDDYLAKPVNPAALREVVAKHLRGG